eukprot:13150755-Alexandrium_andersonii.AAC.1
MKSGKVAGPSNLDCTVHLLRSNGFVVRVWQLDPRRFGVPQSRPRLWFLVVKQTLLDECGISAEQGLQRMTSVMARLARGSVDVLNFARSFPVAVA